MERSDELRERLAGAYRDFREQVAIAATGHSDQRTTPDTLDLASVLIALFDGLAIQLLALRVTAFAEFLRLVPR